MRSLALVAILSASLASPATAAIIKLDFAGTIFGGFNDTNSPQLSSNLPAGAAVTGNLVYGTSALLTDTQSLDGRSRQRGAVGLRLIRSVAMTFARLQRNTTFSFSGPAPGFPAEYSHVQNSLTHVSTGIFSPGATVGEQLRFNAFGYPV
jgi:hypothetical protein